MNLKGKKKKKTSKPANTTKPLEPLEIWTMETAQVLGGETCPKQGEGRRGPLVRYLVFLNWMGFGKEHEWRLPPLNQNTAPGSHPLGAMVACSRVMDPWLSRSVCSTGLGTSGISEAKSLKRDPFSSRPDFQTLESSSLAREVRTKRSPWH